MWPRCRGVPPDFLFRPLSTSPDDDNDNDDNDSDSNDNSSAAATAVVVKASYSGPLQSPSAHLRQRLHADEPLRCSQNCL